MANKTPANGAHAYPPPATKEDADKLLGEIGAACRTVETLMNDAEAELAAVTAKYEAKAKPHGAAVAAKLAALFKWATQNRAKLFAGGLKSLPLSQGRVGFRDTPVKVVIDEADWPAVRRALMRRRLAHTVRIKVEPDLPAIRKERERVEDIAGIHFVPGEQFFAEPIGIDVEKLSLTKKVRAKKSDGAGAASGGGGSVKQLDLEDAIRRRA